MKRIIFFLMAICLIAPIHTEAYGKELSKELKKVYKAKKKEYQKEGWKIFGTSATLEYALLKHFEQLDEGGENVREIVGIASRFKLKNSGYQMSLNSACMTYAQEAGSSLKGRVTNEIFSNGMNYDEEFDKFYAAYERLVEKEIRGELIPSYSIIRDRKSEPGTYEMMTFFVINENAASRARIRALQDAAKESEATRKYAEQISGFVQAGF